MELLSGIVSYGLKYILYLAIALAGIICGKKLRDRKTAKDKRSE